MFSSNLFSHPEKHLYSHLQNVANACLEKFKETNHHLFSFIPEDHWTKLIWLMGFAHDFGKATSYFQEYLFEEDEQKKEQMKNMSETSHSLISSVLAYWIAKQYVDSQNQENELLYMMPFIIFLIIKKHHGNINNSIPLSDEPDELNVPIKHLDVQLSSMNKKELNFLFGFVNKQLQLSISVKKLPESLIEFYKKNLLRKEKRAFKKINKKTEYYLIFQFIYSLLLHSDKEDVIFNRKVKPQRGKVDCDAVKEFKEENFGKPKNKMDLIRENIFQEADQSISETKLSQKIFSLNVPTGTGKTVTSLSAALQLRKRLQKSGIGPRIIYALPFTSIIDQNFQVLDEIFGKPETNLLLKHHHLADISYKEKKAEFEAGESKFLIESWESEIIVTTFFQVFHTLFTNRNRMIQKFHKLANSIILLDEVQIIPYKYWELVRETILKFSELFNAYFILITATQPRIFEQSEIKELVPNKAKYFAKLDRVNIHFDSEPVSKNSFIKLCQEEVKKSDESYLFVMNTINSSVNLFKSLEQMKLDAEYYYLSTNIIPKHRLERIKGIKNTKQRKIIVSTQMVEAGVDIDIENVWRDFAPLESINQVCGRCNRNFREKKGSVRIFQILDDDNKATPFSKYIYGKIALSLLETKESLGNQSEISEIDFLKNMDSYYEKINLKMNPKTSEDNLFFLQNLQFADLYKSFKLIDDPNYDKKDVFIEFDEKAKEVWRKYITLKNIENFFDRKNEFLKFKKDFYDYIISIPVKYVQEDEFKNSGLVYIENYKLDQFYDKKMGWVRTDDNYQAYII